MGGEERKRREQANEGFLGTMTKKAGVWLEVRKRKKAKGECPGLYLGSSWCSRGRMLSGVTHPGAAPWLKQPEAEGGASLPLPAGHPYTAVPCPWHWSLQWPNMPPGTPPQPG